MFVEPPSQTEGHQKAQFACRVSSLIIWTSCTYLDIMHLFGHHALIWTSCTYLDIMPLLGKLSLILVIYDTTSDEACSKEDKSEDSCILTADLPISLESILAFTFI